MCIYKYVWIELYMKSGADQYISKEVDIELKILLGL